MSFFSSLLSGLRYGEGSKPPHVYLQCNGIRMEFPVPPANFEVSVNNNNSTVNINNIGELNMLGKTELKTLSFSSFLPNQNYTFCACTPNKPYSYISKIEKWRTSGSPCRLIISDTPVNFPVSIESFRYGENDGTGDVEFTLNFKEYRFIGNAVDNTNANEITGLKDRPKGILESVTVYPGDSIGDVIGRTISRSDVLGLNEKQSLLAYKSMAKNGGVKAGEVYTPTGILGGGR